MRNVPPFCGQGQRPTISALSGNPPNQATCPHFFRAISHGGDVPPFWNRGQKMVGRRGCQLAGAQNGGTLLCWTDPRGVPPFCKNSCFYLKWWHVPQVAFCACDVPPFRGNATLAGDVPPFLTRGTCHHLTEMHFSAQMVARGSGRRGSMSRATANSPQDQWRAQQPTPHKINGARNSE